LRAFAHSANLLAIDESSKQIIATLPPFSKADYGILKSALPCPRKTPAPAYQAADQAKPLFDADLHVTQPNQLQTLTQKE